MAIVNLCSLDNAVRVKEELEQKLEASRQGLLSAEEKAELAAQVFAEEEETVKELNKELMRKRGIHYKKQQVSDNKRSVTKQ